LGEKWNCGGCLGFGLVLLILSHLDNIWLYSKKGNMVDSIEEFWKEFYSHAEKASKGGLSTIFRGETDSGNELIPSIGRKTKEGTHGDITQLESNLLSEFKRLSLPELQVLPKLELEWLFLAQHYGLPTRLLDWSSNPMVALFFAVHGNENMDGALYIAQHQVTDRYDLYDYRTADVTEEEKRKNPISRLFGIPDQGKVIFMRPRYTDQRYINQKSVFSCPSDPFIPLEVDGFKKIIINYNHKESIRKTLQTMGVSHSFIYPGLGGVVSEVREKEFLPLIRGKLQILTLSAEIPASENIIKL